MARNYEKNFGKLNRLWLEKGTVSKEKRPKLSCLKTTKEISYWIPSIKQELDCFLKQTEVPCYTETKIGECRKHIMSLEAEYKAFVRKLHQLDSSLKATPWTPRPYEKRDKGDQRGLNLHPLDFGTQLSQINLLETPVLMHDHLYQGCEENNSELRSSYIDADTDTADTELSQSTMQRDITAAQGIEVDMEQPPKPQNVLGLDYSSSEEESL
ncbi:hypothetical protein ONE63_010217 [Megalurothrips usitatus]|uniref:Uncharacterized protein n=1 Tax=Megalurothrips usitatus TaxID=439358 RepID=A0AAV7XH41_9NEOP|nr:hypothetical protein ONE63_010217 [Megalurothrips usitatus]